MEERLDKYFNDQYLNGEFMGSVLVAKDDEIIFQKGYGYANYQNKIKNSIDTIYTIGSLTKAFVAMSILILQKEGKLKVTDYVSSYIPQYKWGRYIQIYQLLNHTSGIWCYLRYMDESYWPDAEREHTVDEIYAYFCEKDLDFEPGTQYLYSNSAYVLLGIIIEKLSGKTFGEFIEMNILKPLKMKDTYFDPHYKRIEPMEAIGYEYKDLPELIEAPRLHVSMTYTTGGIKSTVADLYKWEKALHTDILISKEELKDMFKPGLGNYGYAWWIDKYKINHKEYTDVWHWGCSSGYHGLISRLVEEKLVIILLENITSPNLTCPENPEQLLKHKHKICVEFCS